MTQCQKISKKIDYQERIYPEYPTSLEASRWCSDQITGAYKWKKITYEQMKDFCNRIADIFGGNK